MKVHNSLLLFIIFCLISCKKDNNDRWKVNLDNQKTTISLIDISAEFFNPAIDFRQIQTKYPFFLDSNTPDSVWQCRRLDTLEINIYKKVLAKYKNNSKFKQDLSLLFQRVQYYFPQIKVPQIYVYSSGLGGYIEPIVYGIKEEKLFIAQDYFLGEECPDYRSIPIYLRKTMSDKYLLAKIAQVVAQEIVPFDPNNHQKFLDKLIYQGKLKVIVDALLPEMTEDVKMNYTPAQIAWCKGNEYSVWDYFLSNNLLFDSNPKLDDRFIKIAPFSKFYSDADTESPGSIGVWYGWQIAKKYMIENDNVTLKQLVLDDNYQKIFTNSKYKPIKP